MVTHPVDSVRLVMKRRFCGVANARYGSEADPHSLQVSRDGRHQEWNANTTDKHTNGDKTLPAVGQPFGRQKLRIEQGVSWIPQRFSPPEPNPCLCSTRGLHRKDNGRKPHDDCRAPGGNESEKRNSGKDFCHGIDYVCFGSKSGPYVAMSIRPFREEGGCPKAAYRRPRFRTPDTGQ